MNDSTDAVAIGALILMALEEAKVSVDEEVRLRIRDLLSDITEKPPDKQIRSIVKALDVLRDYAPVRLVLISNLQSVAGESPSTQGALIRRLLEPLSLEGSYDPLYVCPVDPTHYRRRAGGSQESLQCPLHRVELELEQ